MVILRVINQTTTQKIAPCSSGFRNRVLDFLCFVIVVRVRVRACARVRVCVRVYVGARVRVFGWFLCFFSEMLRKGKFQNFWKCLETELVEVLLERASFRANVKPLLVVDCKQTLMALITIRSKARSTTSAIQLVSTMS